VVRVETPERWPTLTLYEDGTPSLVDSMDVALHGRALVVSGPAVLIRGCSATGTGARLAELLRDLTEVTHLAAAGLTLIVAARNNEGGIHGRLHLVGVIGNRPVERALQVAGLSVVLDVHDDVSALLDALP
jgi:hypothetical protein